MPTHEHEIGQATYPVETNARLPVRQRAASALKPTTEVPSASNGRQFVRETQFKTAAGGDVQVSTETRVACDIAALVGRIAELQKIRRFCIVSQSRCDRSIESLIASSLGYRADQTPAERKAMFKRASEIRKATEKNGVEGQPSTDTHEAVALSSVLHLIPVSATARALWDARRAEVEREMAQAAALLPVAKWTEQIKGFTHLCLAIVIGEAGRPLDQYGTVSKLWKRLGLAVISSERQRRKTDKEAAAQHGYSPHRRSEIYVVGSVSLFLAQKPGMRYRDIYDQRRTHTAPRVVATSDLKATDPMKWTLGRCDNDARRVMTKALIADLWGEWQRA